MSGAAENASPPGERPVEAAGTAVFVAEFPTPPAFSAPRDRTAAASRAHGQAPRGEAAACRVSFPGRGRGNPVLETIACMAAAARPSRNERRRGAASSAGWCGSRRHGPIHLGSGWLRPLYMLHATGGALRCSRRAGPERTSKGSEAHCGGGGQGEIRTHETRKGSPHFECGAINHSTTCPRWANPILGAAANRKGPQSGG